jgi:hypothetical protein
VSVPVIVSVTDGLAPMGLTGTAPGDFGEVTASQIDITSPGHPLAAGLSGTVSVFSPARAAGHGIPTAAATKVGRAVGAPSASSSIFGYEAAAAMVGLAAPERRVGFFVRTNGTPSLTAQGWSLFDAAVQWASASDADGDGIGFADEHRHGTDPSTPDTDGDGYSDSEELENGTSATNTDADGDGLSNAAELALGTDPYHPDSDGDGVGDASDCFPLDRGRFICHAQNPFDTTPPTINLLYEPRNLTPTSVVPPVQ